jgi:glycogen phosphorylase
MTQNTVTFPSEPNNRSSLKRELIEQLTLNVGVSVSEAGAGDWLQATGLVVRNRIAARWHDANRQIKSSAAKQVYYLSIEFHIGRELRNALMATGLEPECRLALAELGVALEDLIAIEPDPALGNGGLGRLAACFLDSMAHLGIPGIGYGIHYEFGNFRQELVDGWQVEQPDLWLKGSNIWEYQRPERSYRVRFGGRVEHRDFRAHWVNTEDIIAVAHDILIPGRRTVNTLRLWDARPIRPLDIGLFNRGGFAEAFSPTIRSRTIVSLLYPDDGTLEGRELRLRQEYFFVSASIQDILARFRAEFTDWSALQQKVAIHLNDTHPALAPAELMRQLVDEHQISWDVAWAITCEVFSYTNHTLMPEALEVWPIELMERVVPRHVDIIAEINRRFLEGVSTAARFNPSQRAGVALIMGETKQNVSMGRLSVLASRRINGVSILHSRLVREQLFADFARIFPDRFTNVTNGVTHRRWLYQANPDLTALIDARLGRSWRETFDIGQIAGYADDASFRANVREVKVANKKRLAKGIADLLRIEVDPLAMFDVQIKRIHEYKRQLLNILAIVARWNAIRAEPEGQWVARVSIMAGKAASAYWFAKLIIKLAHDVSRRINADPVTSNRLKLVFLPNYNVSLAEAIIPGTDLSEQISLAGTEASGTGNMKLALNGALTIATEDGANLEIADAVGRDNMFLFGLQTDEVARLRGGFYVPTDLYHAEPMISTVVDQIASGEFSPNEPHRFQPIVDALLKDGDHFLVLRDFISYWAAQREVDRVWSNQEEWTRKAILNIAAMGTFSSDRAVAEYASKIWNAGVL